MKNHLFNSCVLRLAVLSCMSGGIGGDSMYAQTSDKEQNKSGEQRSGVVTERPQIRNSTDSEHTVEKIHDSLQVRPGYMVQVVASEPLIADPVTARLDHHGRLWVVEMPDYPLGPSEGERPAGRIKILKDLDQDGVFDQATVFADELLFATGVQPYRDGAFVTLAGKIVFLRDRDGDDRADESVILFEGFAEQNQQLRANHPT